MATPNEVEVVLDNGIGVTVAGSDILRRVKLLPYGTLQGRDGRGPWILEGRAHASDVIATTQRVQGGTDMMFDYDHQSALAAVPGVGGTARAAGWIKPATLKAEDDGIYGDVEWTQAAEAAIRAKEYRYHSPHFRAARGTGRITRLVNAGLTNSPNLDFPALASQQRSDDPSTCAALTDAERHICETLGVNPEIFTSAREQEASQQRIASRLTKDELAVCELLGVSPETFVAARDEEANHRRMYAQLTKEERYVCDTMGTKPEVFLSARNGERNV